jgi:hypothetical protein
MYLAIGLEVLLAVKWAGIAGPALVCLLDEEEEEQPTRKTATKSQLSRIEFIIAALLSVAAPANSAGAWTGVG